MNYSNALANYVANTNYENIPKEVVEWTKKIMLDTLSCAVAGFTMAPDECAWIERVVMEMGGTPESTIWKTGVKTSSMNAALANATMIHTVDFDDTHLDSVSHLGAALLGVAISVGEKNKISGKEVITAFILGFEVAARVGNAVNKFGRTHYKYWHPTATMGTIGAAITAAKLMKLSAEQIEDALGLGVDQAVGFRYCIDKGDYSKSLHPGFAAMRGVLSAHIISAGGNGPKGLLEYETGFCNATASNPNIESLTEDLGSKYFIMTDALKFFPTIHCSHTGIEGMLNIVTKHKLNYQDIESVDLKVTDLAKGQGMTFDPQSTLAARLSIPYSVATAAVKKRLTLNDFDEESLANQEVRMFMKKITIASEPKFNEFYPKGLVTQIKVKLNSGEEYEELIIYPKGHPERPATDEDIMNKYEYLSTITWNKEKSKKISAMMFALDDMSDISKLVDEITS